MAMNIAQTFIQLCQQAVDRDLETLDCTEVEPILIALLQLVRSHPEHRQEFVNLFITVADGEIITPMYLGSSGLAGQQISIYRIRKTGKSSPRFRPSLTVS